MVVVVWGGGGGGGELSTFKNFPRYSSNTRGITCCDGYPIFDAMFSQILTF